jgi:hypothetical protein
MSNSRRAGSGNQTPGRGSYASGSQSPPKNRQPGSDYGQTATQHRQTETQSSRPESGYDQPATRDRRTEPGHREAERPRKQPLWHYALLGLLGLIAIGGIISLIVENSGGPAPAAAAPTAPRAATVGSTFVTRDAAGTTYRVRLTRFIDPATGVGTTPASGNRLVGAVYTVTGVSGSPAGENVVTNASLLSSTGHIYRATGGRIA